MTRKTQRNSLGFGEISWVNLVAETGNPLATASRVSAKYKVPASPRTRSLIGSRNTIREYTT